MNGGISFNNMPKTDKTKIAGSMLIGISQTFYSLNAITKHRLDSMIDNLVVDEWYPLSHLDKIFETLEETGLSNPLLLYQAGQKFILAWYEAEGKALGHGSLGHIMLQDNSNGIKLVFKDYDPEKLYSKVTLMDEDAGTAVVETSAVMPVDFLNGIFYTGVAMWEDLLWLEMETEVIKSKDSYPITKFTYHFKKQNPDYPLNKLNQFLSQLSQGEDTSITQEMATELAWYLKGSRKIYEIERNINEESNKVLGSALKEQLTLKEKLETANKRIKQQAREDYLTGIFNRRYFNDSFQDLWHRSARREENVTVFMIDIDHFKLFNDNYGHVKGDEALKITANCIRKTFLRNEDIVARYGGEEFVVVTTASSINTIEEMAKRLQSNLRDMNVPHAYSPVSDKLTISIGSASFKLTKHTSIALSNRLLQLADDALYAAKESGRNTHKHLEFVET